MDYTEVVKQLLHKQYPDKQTTKITINTMNIKFIPAKAKSMFQSYLQLTSLSLVNCDLRKLQNFPVLPCLADLDLSSNNLQGTLNYLMPLKSLTYLNLSLLLPLKRLTNVEVCLLENPCTSIQNWKQKAKSLHIKFLKGPKQISEEVVQSKKDSPVIPLKQQPQDQMEKPIAEFGNFREKMLNTFQRNLDLQINRIPDLSQQFPPLNVHRQQLNERGQQLQRNGVESDGYSDDSDLDGLPMQNDLLEEEDEQMLVGNEEGDVYQLEDDEDSDNEGEENEDQDGPEYF